MTTHRTIQIWMLLLLGSVFTVVGMQAAEDTPPFQEVLGLVRSNLAGANPAELDQAAVQGFINELSPRVALVESSGESEVTTPTEARAEGHVYRGSTAYIRLSAVASNAAAQVKQTFDQLAASNTLSGLVLDLRFADGKDYAAAVAVADLFLEQEVPLLNWGEGLKRSHEKENAILCPVAVLVNEKTGEAAEALAAMLRQSGVALLLGSRTSGTAGIQETFPLSTGQKLRITVANVQLGDAKQLGTNGVTPDVKVEIPLADERHFIEDPTYEPPASTSAGTDSDSETNNVATARRTRTDEAELVRRWRGEAPTPSSDRTEPAALDAKRVRDPVLLRALDLMEGLAILRSSQR